MNNNEISRIHPCEDIREVKSLEMVDSIHLPSDMVRQILVGRQELLDGQAVGYKFG